MKSFNLILFCLLIITYPVLPQGNYIKGRVLDKKTGTPVHFADVYLSGTTIGASTDEDGNFNIATVRPGSYKLVASMIGYNSVIRDINVRNDSRLQFELFLEEKIYEVEPITVSGERPEDWDKCYKEFLRLFLGNSKYAEGCKIENPLVLSFNEIEGDLVTASADSSLVINNEYLGYKIVCTLIEFRYNRKNQHLRYVILPRFFDLVPANSPDRVAYANHRLGVYEGSIQHFIKGLINNDFILKGYKVYKRPVVDYSETNYLRYYIDDSASLIKNSSDESYDLSYDGYLKVIYGDKLSWIKLEYPEVTVNPNGFSSIFTPFEVRGYWATEGISTLLPADFQGF